MALGSTGDDDEITGINVTPLVDVMLVLLVIFMVTTTYIVQRSIAVKLPKAETGEESIKSKSLAFVLDGDSVLYLDGKLIKYEDIAAKIEDAREEFGADKTNIQALISADEKTPHGAVVKLIDYIRKNGIANFAFNVELETTN